MNNFQFWIPVFLSIVLAIWNLFLQRNQLKLKRSSDKQLFIHRLQFEKEFNIYSEIWTILVELKNSAGMLNAAIEAIPMDIDAEEHKRNKLDSTIKVGNLFIEKVEQNKPFYSSIVYTSLKNVIDLVRTEIIENKRGERNSKDFWERTEKRVPILISSVENVCEEIRERIGILEK